MWGEGPGALGPPTPPEALGSLYILRISFICFGLLIMNVIPQSYCLAGLLRDRCAVRFTLHLNQPKNVILSMSNAGPYFYVRTDLYSFPDIPPCQCCIGVLHRCAASVCCIGVLHRCAASVCCIGALHRDAASGRCIGALHRGAASGRCIGALHRGAASGRCIGALHRGAASGRCIGALHQCSA